MTTTKKDPLREHEIKKRELWALCEGFIKQNNIWGGEVVYTYDRVADQYYEFVARICDIVGYVPMPDEDD